MTALTPRLHLFVPVPAFLLLDREKEIAALHARIAELENDVAFWRGINMTMEEED